MGKVYLKMGLIIRNQNKKATMNNKRKKMHNFATPSKANETPPKKSKKNYYHFVQKNIIPMRIEMEST